MSGKIGFADAVRGGGDGWRVHGLIAAGGIENVRGAALFLACEPVSRDFKDYCLMSGAMLYRAGNCRYSPCALPSLLSVRGLSRLGAVE